VHVVVARPMRPNVERIRGQLRHPVIDVDGHSVEVTPVLNDFLAELGGPDAPNRFGAALYEANARTDFGFGKWGIQPRHWTMPADTLDRATAALPRLYAERMDEIGLDFSLVYPTLGLVFPAIEDDEMRALACRAVNHYMAELHADLSDRLLPVGVVPMHTPEEAIAELDHVVGDLGIRAVMIPSFVKRPFGARVREQGYRVDAYGIDSEHDYDPFWARCVELGVVPGVHSPVHGMPMHESVTNFVYTHIGQFSGGAEVFCRSTFLGGVYHRFPELKVAALEGGVGWAVTLYANLLGHWEKRNGSAVTQYDPARLDPDVMRGLLEEHGSDRLHATLDDALESLVHPASFGQPSQLDDFAACPFESGEALRDAFTSHIYVGCEADDPMTALAFDSEKNALGARLRVILGSDIGHWDVTDVGNVLGEAYELVDDGLMSEDDFEAFAFANPVELYAGSNPGFFAGTRVEQQVADWMNRA
jgi:predicted TIM-barrel fold metal-dependent hydrolase